MNFSFLLIFLSVFATIGAFRLKRDRFLKFHGHQISGDNSDSKNDQDTNGQHETLKRRKQLMRMIANIQVCFGSFVNNDRFQLDHFILFSHITNEMLL